VGVGREAGVVGRAAVEAGGRSWAAGVVGQQGAVVVDAVVDGDARAGEDVALLPIGARVGDVGIAVEGRAVVAIAGPGGRVSIAVAHRLGAVASLRVTVVLDRRGLAAEAAEAEQGESDEQRPWEHEAELGEGRRGRAKRHGWSPTAGRRAAFATLAPADPAAWIA